jgi:hypothetical protein
MRKWRRCQCTSHKCKYRAQRDSDFCSACELDKEWCAAMYEYEKNKERLPKGGVSRSRRVEESSEDVPF